MILITEVNDVAYELDVKEDLRLIDLIRDVIGLTGTKEGCSEGECGACTIIIDERAVNSCMMMAHQVHGKKVYTIESLNKDATLDQLQQSFIEKGAVQCGFCTPGMLMSAKALLLRDKNPSESAIKKALEGNLCRCTGYNKILDAVNHTVEVMKE